MLLHWVSFAVWAASRSSAPYSSVSNTLYPLPSSLSAQSSWKLYSPRPSAVRSCSSVASNHPLHVCGPVWQQRVFGAGSRRRPPRTASGLCRQSCHPTTNTLPPHWHLHPPDPPHTAPAPPRTNCSCRAPSPSAAAKGGRRRCRHLQAFVVAVELISSRRCYPY